MFSKCKHKHIYRHSLVDEPFNNTTYTYEELPKEYKKEVDTRYAKYKDALRQCTEECKK